MKKGIILLACVAVISVALLGVINSRENTGIGNENTTSNSGVNTTTEPQTTSIAVEHIDDKYTLSVEIPEGWEYEQIEYPYATHSPRYCIKFWPKGETEGKISVQYNNGLFGVCGTGLSCEEVNIGKYSASMGTYDNNEVWNYIVFDYNDADGNSYVILNEGADIWWDKYGDDAMKILDTVLIGVDNYELCSLPLK